MKKMLKRADGSTSQRGLWDNIRAKAAANKKAGKKGKAPSKAMLEQERNIEEKKTGGVNKYQRGNFFKKEACIGESCGKVVDSGESYGGGSNSGTNYTGKGATTLSSKPKIDRSRIVNQTADEKLAGLENRNKYALEGQAAKARKKAEREARAKESAPAEVELDFKRVYATEPEKKNLGGKKKSDWFSESKELKFGGKSKKRMGGKNC
jgi:hypothetical protein